MAGRWGPGIPTTSRENQRQWAREDAQAEIDEYECPARGGGKPCVRVAALGGVCKYCGN